MTRYTLIYYVCSVVDGKITEDHVAVAEYTSASPPWVPRKGEYVRLRELSPLVVEAKGHVQEIVTVIYGNGDGTPATVIEVYLAKKAP